MESKCTWLILKVDQFSCKEKNLESCIGPSGASVCKGRAYYMQFQEQLQHYTH